jgi:hypothetical protein
LFSLPAGSERATFQNKAPFLTKCFIGTIEDAFMTTPTHWHSPLQTNKHGLRMTGLEDYFKLLTWYLFGKPWEG